MKRINHRSSIVLSIISILTACLIIFSSGCAKKEEKEIKIGAIFDLTGSLNYMGQWSLEGAQIAVDEINEKGGIKGKTLKLIVEDAETQPQKAVSAFQKLITINKISVATGFNGSSEVMACAPIANDTKTVLFSTGGASPAITLAGDYIFRNRLSGSLEVYKMAEIVRKEMDIKNMAIFYINTEYGLGYKKYFASKFKELGGNILMEDSFEQDDTDFRSQLNKFKQIVNLQAIYIVTHVREGAMILKQAKELGLKVQWFSSNAIEGPELFKIAGTATEGLMFTVSYYDPHSKSAQSFNDQYRSKYGRDSEMFAANAYDAVKIISLLYETKAIKNGEDIKKALYKIQDYPGAAGLTSFDSNGDVLRPIVVKRVIRGHLENYIVR